MGKDLYCARRYFFRLLVDEKCGDVQNGDDGNSTAARSNGTPNRKKKGTGSPHGRNHSRVSPGQSRGSGIAAVISILVVAVYLLKFDNSYSLWAIQVALLPSVLLSMKVHFWVINDCRLAVVLITCMHAIRTFSRLVLMKFALARWDCCVTQTYWFI